MSCNEKDMKDNMNSDNAVIVGLSYCFSKLFFFLLPFISPLPDTFSSLYLLFGLLLSLHCNHLCRGACHPYLLISSDPVLLWALLHLNVRLMSLPHPPDTSAQRLLKAFMEQCEPGGWYKLKRPLFLFLGIMALKGQVLARNGERERETGSISYDWLPSSGFDKRLLPNCYIAVGAIERKQQNSHHLKLHFFTVTTENYKDFLHLS